MIQQPHALSSRAEERFCLWGRTLQNNHNSFGHGLIAVAIMFLDDVTPSSPLQRNWKHSELMRLRTKISPLCEASSVHSVQYMDNLPLTVVHMANCAMQHHHGHYCHFHSIEKVASSIRYPVIRLNMRGCLKRSYDGKDNRLKASKEKI